MAASAETVDLAAPESRMNPHRTRHHTKKIKRPKKPVGDWIAEKKERDARVTAEYGRSAHYACGRKARYPTKADAIERAAVGIAHGQKFLRAYECPYCGGWHLTSHMYE